MDWYYADGGKQVGPVTESQFEDLVRAGTITPETLVWRAGMPQWQPCRTARGGVSAPVPAAPGSVTCSECGRAFPPGEVIAYGGSTVCAACKPRFLQQLQEGVSPSGAVGLWRSGKLLVAKLGSHLPDCCVKCNVPAPGPRLKRKLYWHHPAVYLLILISILVYAIVALVVRKRANLEIGLCERHRAKRRRDIGLSWGLALLGVGLIIGAIVVESGWLALAGTLTFLTSLIYAAVTVSIVSAKRIDQDYVWVRGVAPDFLRALPEWRERS